MKCMPSMPVFSNIRHLQIGEDSLKGDDIDGCFYYFFFTVILLLLCIRARSFLAKLGVLLVVTDRTHLPRQHQGWCQRADISVRPENVMTEMP